MRTIDADALKDKARELIPNYHASVVMNLFDLIDNLADNVPTVDAEPVRHGRWMDGGYACGETEWICSACGFSEWRTSNSRMIYCMHCGARMDGEQDG